MSKLDFSSSNTSLDTDNGKRRHCICQKSEDELNEEDDSDDFMIECDGCNLWFHGRCVSLADRVADDIEKYFCAECSKVHGPLIFKQRKNYHRRDYSDGNAENKPVQSGTRDFINQLKRRTFLDCEPVIQRMRGDQVTRDYLLKDGFTKPILICNRDGLDIKLPNRSITLGEINRLIGENHYVDVIDCEKQVIYKMNFKDYVDYFENYDRNKIYNILSLEISNTKLGESVVTPKIVRDLSWATTGIWPQKKQDGHARLSEHKVDSSPANTDQSDDDEDLKLHHFEKFDRPDVAKYCLISPQSSYTDFHIDFGGSSVWYSILRGEKIFYLIEPTDENLQKYTDWSKSPTESETFLGDCVSHCYRMHIREGNTILLPPGWIHAVYTVTDSVVFGGNFLQSMGVDMQLRVYELERETKVAQKFQYPMFETFHWYAANHFYKELRECNNSKSTAVDSMTQQAAEAIIRHMSRWLAADKRYQIRNRYIIPRDINCDKLLRNLARELDRAKTRFDSSNQLKAHSVTPITSTSKAAFAPANKHEQIQSNIRKIKIKCRHRLPSKSDVTKKRELKFGDEIKLFMKSTINNEQKGIVNKILLKKIPKKSSELSLQSTQTINKTGNFENGNASKTSQKIDDEAKRQRLLQDSLYRSFIGRKEPIHQSNTSATFGKPPEDYIQNHDCQDGLLDIAEGGLASFIKKSSVNNDCHSESPVKQEQHSSSLKAPYFHKSNLPSSELATKIKKKIKVENKHTSEERNASATALPLIVSKSVVPAPKRLLSPTNAPLGKILRIADSIKSDEGVST